MKTNKRLEVYKCNICGNIVEVLYASGGELVCCGQPMELLKEKIEETGLEKHLPVIERTDTGLRVKVGKIPHPMEEKHYIEWIEVIANDTIYKKFLKPGDKPEAKFKLNSEATKARAYCNIHGLWKSYFL